MAWPRAPDTVALSPDAPEVAPVAWLVTPETLLVGSWALPAGDAAGGLGGLADHGRHAGADVTDVQQAAGRDDLEDPGQAGEAEGRAEVQQRGGREAGTAGTAGVVLAMAGADIRALEARTAAVAAPPKKIRRLNTTTPFRL